MAFTIISIKESKGTYEGSNYHNFIIYGLNPDTENKAIVAGGEVELFKIKAENFVEACSRNITALNNPSITRAADILGLLINPIYNKYGGVDDFILAIPDTKKK